MQKVSRGQANKARLESTGRLNWFPPLFRDSIRSFQASTGDDSELLFREGYQTVAEATSKDLATAIST
jgi:hypothetical protein